MFLKEEERPAGEPAKVLDDASKLLLKAADLMELRGHCRGRGRDAVGRLCAMEAIYTAADQNRARAEAAAERFEKALGLEDVPFKRGGAFYSDSQPTETVLAALRRVALGL